MLPSRRDAVSPRLMAYPGSGHNFFNINQLRVLGVLCGEISGLTQPCSSGNTFQHLESEFTE